MPYSFPDGTTGTVQLRPRDQSNINGLVTGAQVQLAAGAADPMPFRDRENVTHSLTPQQVVAMGAQALAFVSAMYTAAWAHKDAVSAAERAGDRVAVEGYDYSGGWP
jgi:hypothetical protein